MCRDGGYRYTRKGKPTKEGRQKYNCVRMHKGCRAKVVMDKRGNITRSGTDPHLEECLNPPTASDSKKGNKNRAKGTKKTN